MSLNPTEFYLPDYGADYFSYRAYTSNSKFIIIFLDFALAPLWGVRAGDIELNTYGGIPRYVGSISWYWGSFVDSYGNGSGVYFTGTTNSTQVYLMSSTSFTKHRGFSLRCLHQP